ncbi:MAG TPA: CAP domain-containing protein [Actinomycetota bacterium]
MPLALLTTLALGLGTVAAPTATAGDGYRGTLLRMLNRTRERHDLKPLAIHRELSKDARTHTRRMIREDRVFDPPNLQQILAPYPWDEIGAAVVGCASTVRRLHRAWMHSDLHREILLHPKLRKVGIGPIRNDDRNACGRGSIWGTQLLFG